MTYLFILALGLQLAGTPEAEVTTPEFALPPDAKAAVLGQQLYQSALDPAVDIDGLLASIDEPVQQRAIKVRALTFADLHLRGLRRFCIAQGGKQVNAPVAKLAHYPSTAFLPAEIEQTRQLLPQLRENIDTLWQEHAQTYHDRIRSLKRSCPEIPGSIGVVRHEMHKLFGVLPIFPGYGKTELRRLLDDVVEAVDVEAAFPRVQFAVNGLSYNLGHRVIEDDASLVTLRRFLQRYSQFAQRPEDNQRLLQQALLAADHNVGRAVWMIAFAFRNLPHIYDIYLLDPVRAAKLEILFLRIKHYRRQLLKNESKMLLHYPASVYQKGDRRSSPYHFWSGGYVAHELFSRGHSATISAVIGGGAQAGYEILSALKYTLTQPQVGKDPLDRLLYFFERSKTWEDSAGGLFGAFEILDVAIEQMQLPRPDQYRFLRHEAWQFLSRVKALRLIYDNR